MPVITGLSSSVTGQEQVILDPSEVADPGRVELDITAFIDVDGVDWGDAAIEAYMADARRGSSPVDYRVPNRTVTIPLNLLDRGSVTFDEIRTQLQAKVGLFQREGGCVKRDAAVGPVFADVVGATLKLGGSYLQSARGIDIDAVLTLECLPDWYGDERTLDDDTETSKVALVKVLKDTTVNAVIAGNYPGRVRVVVDEDDADTQLGLLWGFRSRYYDSATTAALLYEAEALTAKDTAAIATVTGASGGGSNNVMQHTSLATSWTPVVSTQIASGSAHMTHKGTYRVWARCYSTSTTPPRVRFLWDVGDLVAPVDNASVTIPGASQFYLIDLGEIRLDPAAVGTHRWQGVIQAKGAAGGENVSVDVLMFQPIDDGAGKLTASLSVDPGWVLYSARDEFNQSAGALTGKTAPVGGTWAGAGDATLDATVDATNHYVTRTSSHTDANTETGRYLISGVTGFAAQAVQTDFKFVTITVQTEYMGVLARYTDTSNWFRAIIGQTNVLIGKRVAGTVTNFVSGTHGLGLSADTWYTIRAHVDAAGRWFVWLYPQGGSPGDPVWVGQDSALATGGGLATGKPGIYSYINFP